MTFSVDDLLDDAAASASPNASAGAHTPPGNDGPINIVLAAFAARELSADIQTHDV